MKQYLIAASLLCVFALVCVFALAPAARAAIGDQSLDPAANNGSDQSDDTPAKPQAAPSPTPGSKATSAPVAEATTDVKSLGPNEALFDAINRGDLDAARDAIARGADLDARNSLGQKPIDASIDLGRNDITFVLLAERPLTENVATSGPAPAAVPEKPAVHAKNPVREVAAVKPAPNPGTPKPAIGFLGF